MANQHLFVKPCGSILKVEAHPDSFDESDSHDPATVFVDRQSAHSLSKGKVNSPLLCLVLPPRMAHTVGTCITFWGSLMIGLLERLKSSLEIWHSWLMALL